MVAKQLEKIPIVPEDGSIVESELLPQALVEKNQEQEKTLQEFT